MKELKKALQMALEALEQSERKINLDVFKQLNEEYEADPEGEIFELVTPTEDYLTIEPWNDGEILLAITDKNARASLTVPVNAFPDLAKIINLLTGGE